LMCIAVQWKNFQVFQVCQQPCVLWHIAKCWIIGRRPLSQQHTKYVNSYLRISDKPTTLAF